MLWYRPVYKIEPGIYETGEWFRTEEEARNSQPDRSPIFISSRITPDKHEGGAK